jgi:hypothetical protein
MSDQLMLSFQSDTHERTGQQLDNDSLGTALLALSHVRTTVVPTI